MINKFLTWFDDSHHWQHFIGGAAIGFGADDEYCAIYAGALVAAALEFKDKQWGGEFDCADFTTTVLGVFIGYTIRRMIFL